MTQAIRVVSRIQDQDDVDNVAPSDGVILVGDGDKFIADALEHAIGGDRHSASTLADLNSKISDATLDDSSSTRPPATHATSHATAGGDPIAPADIGAASLGGNTFTDNQNLGGNQLLRYREGQSIANVTGVVTIDREDGNMLERTLTGNVTWTFANIADGDSVTIVRIQDATGGRTETWPAGIFWQGGELPDLATAAGARSSVVIWRLNGDSYGADAGLFATV